MDESAGASSPSDSGAGSGSMAGTASQQPSLSGRAVVDCGTFTEQAVRLGLVSESRVTELRELVALGYDTEQSIAKFCYHKLLDFQECERAGQIILRCWQHYICNVHEDPDDFELYHRMTDDAISPPDVLFSFVLRDPEGSPCMWIDPSM